MKKTYLAAAAILGAAIFAGEAHAVKLTYGDGKSFKMGFRAKIHAIYGGKRFDSDTLSYDRNVDDFTPVGSSDKSDIRFSVPNARIYAKGSISKIFKWAFQGDFGGRIRTSENNGHQHTVGNGAFKIVDAFIMLDFMKEFKVVAGGIKVPWERHSGIQSGWSYIMPAGPAYGSAYKLFSNPFFEKLPGSGSRSPLVGVWGNVADGMVKYYLTLVDGTDQTDNDDAKTGYAIRVQFAPTMLGYKNDPGYVLKETYLGKQNSLVIGLSYATQDVGGAFRYRISPENGDRLIDEPVDKFQAFAVDLLWEQKMGMITPTVTAAYAQKKYDWVGGGDDKLKGFLIQGQVLLNQKFFLGKPAVAVRYMQSDWSDESDDKESVLGIVGQLYVKGVGNRIALSIDNVKRDDGLAAVMGTKDSYTDITLAFWYNF